MKILPYIMLFSIIFYLRVRDGYQQEINYFIYFNLCFLWKLQSLFYCFFIFIKQDLYFINFYQIYKNLLFSLYVNNIKLNMKRITMPQHDFL